MRRHSPGSDDADRRDVMDRTFNRWLPVLAVIAVLGVAAVAASTSSPEISKLPVPPLDPSPPRRPTCRPAPRCALPPEAAADQASSSAFPDWADVHRRDPVHRSCWSSPLGVLVWSLLRNGDPKRKARLFVEPKQPDPMTDDVRRGSPRWTPASSSSPTPTPTRAGPSSRAGCGWSRPPRPPAPHGEPATAPPTWSPGCSRPSDQPADPRRASPPSTARPATRPTPSTSGPGQARDRALRHCAPSSRCAGLSRSRPSRITPTTWSASRSSSTPAGRRRRRPAAGAPRVPAV